MTSSRGFRAAVAALTAVSVVVLSGTALAYFTTTGSGTVAAGVGQLGVPTIGGATPAVGGTVALSWAAVGAPGSGSVAYYVTRNGGEPAGTCPSPSSPEEAITSCTDSGLEPGTYTYTVTARWRSWTATSSPSSARVAVGAPTHLTLTIASSTPTAGTADNLTVTAKDANGATVTTYAGSHSLTFSGASASPGGTAPTVSNSSGTAVAFGAATALTFTAGVASVGSSKNGVMKLYQAGPATISASDGSIESEADPAVTVAAASMSKLALAAATTTPVAGVADNLTTTAQDAYGNTATSYTGSHSLVYSGASASPGGTAPTVSNSSGTAVAFGAATPTTFTAGVSGVSGASNGAMKLYRSGAASIKVTEGSTSSAALSTTTSAASAAKLALAAATTTPVAGVADNLTTTAQDAYGNTATSYTGSHNITFSGAEASPGGTAPTVVNSSGTAVAFGAATALTFTSGVASVGSSKNGVMKLADVGSAAVGASDGSVSTASGLALTVSPGAAARFAWAAPAISAGILGSPCLFTCTITGIGNGGTFVAAVAVTDSLGNVVSNLGSGHAVNVTATGGTVTGGSLTIPEAGPAETEATFTYKSRSSGTFTDTITAAKSTGTAYTSATATASH